MSPQLAIETCVGDPSLRGGVQVRIMVDGSPLIAAAFDRGPALSPTGLLERGLLRASEEPTEVKLAVAWCDEGCCGALFVTIVREGDTVRWYNWRRPPTPAAEPQPAGLPELCFAAVAYDAEVARAEGDRSWEWSAYTVARLLRREVREHPDFLDQWSCAPGWIGTHYERRDRVEISFTYPRRASEGIEAHAPWLQFIWSIPDDGRPPERQAEAALLSLSEVDPTSHARIVGGSREHADALGFTWPADPDRIAP